MKQSICAILVMAAPRSHWRSLPSILCLPENSDRPTLFNPASQLRRAESGGWAGAIQSQRHRVRLTASPLRTSTSSIRATIGFWVGATPTTCSQGNFRPTWCWAAAARRGLDFTQHSRGGPGTNQSTGLYRPPALPWTPAGMCTSPIPATTASCASRPRISSKPAISIVDLVIGQKTSSSGSLQNQGLQPPARTVCLSLSPSPRENPTSAPVWPWMVKVTLWAADVGNNRVLGFPPANLAANNATAR